MEDATAAVEQSAKMPKDKRRELLAQAIQQEVVAGARVQSQSEYNAVLVTGKRVNHGLHLLLSLFTAGFWAIVWIVLAITGGEKRTMVSVDEYGNILRQEV